MAKPSEGRGLSSVACQTGRTASLVGILILTLVLSAGSSWAAPAEAPLTIGDVTIETGSIYTPEELEAASGSLRFLHKVMNGLHVDTRHFILQRELLFEPGDPYDPELLEETERNLRNLGFLNSAHVVAVDTTDDGRVNIKVATRESWTLRAAFSFSIASGDNARWRASLSERNFLGYGFTAGAGVGQDENASYWDVFFRQRRLLGRNLELGFSYSNRQDGYSNSVDLRRPFYAQDDPWGFDTLAWNALSERRFYLSNASPAGIDPDANRSLYARLPYDNAGAEGRILLRAGPGGGRIWRVGAGIRFTDRKDHLDDPPYELSDGRYDDLQWLAQDEVFARDQGSTVYPHLVVQSLGRKWEKSRFIMQYGSVEDLPTEFLLNFRAGPAGGNMGSTTGFAEDRWRFEGDVQRWIKAAGGFLFLRGAGWADAGSRRVSWYKYEFVGGWVGQAGDEMSPWITRVWAEYGQGSRLGGGHAMLLGLDRGMRTLEFDGMAGDHLARWNVEQGKAHPDEFFGLIRAGAAVFYNGGRAWWKDEGRDPQGFVHELGFGIRLGPTRSSNSMTSRLDISWDLTGSGSPVFTASSQGLF